MSGDIEKPFSKSNKTYGYNPVNNFNYIHARPAGGAKRRTNGDM